MTTLPPSMLGASSSASAPRGCRSSPPPPPPPHPRLTPPPSTPPSPEPKPLNPAQVVHKAYEIINVDRSALGRVAGVIAKHHGDNGFAGTVKLTLTGSGGQSFGCFNIKVGGWGGMGAVRYALGG